MNEQTPNTDAQAQPSNAQGAKSPPVDKCHDGRLTVSIWKNPGEHGPIYNATVNYSYQDKDGNWRDTSSIPGHELLKVGRLSEKAYDKIRAFKDQDRAQYVEQQQAQTQEPPTQSHAR